MTDIQERPFKIRKLEPVEDSEAFLEPPSKPSSSLSTEKDESEQLGEKEQTETQSAQPETQEQVTLSKNQSKKLRRKEQWEAGNEYRKAKRREKHKEKQARKAGRRKELEEKIADGGIETADVVPKKEERKRPIRPIQVPLTLILDCDFNDLMTEKEIKSMGAQLTRCYSDNKSNPYRTHLVFSSWGGKLKERFEVALANAHHGWKGVRFSERDFVVAAEDLDEVMRSTSGGKSVGALAGEGTVEVKVVTAAAPKSKEPSAILANSTIPNSNEAAPLESQSSAPESREVLEDMAISTSSAPGPDSVSSLAVDTDQQRDLQPTDPSPKPKPKPKVIYLTSDSPHTLDRLEPNTSYIIGGIVDKNRHKGICYKRACERGIETARLPIGEYMTMQSRSVLTINHVVEIMLKWLETGDWGESFLKVIPKRKEAKLRVKRTAGGEDVDAVKLEESEDDADEGVNVVE